MSSDEDFSLVVNHQASEETLEGIQALISSYKKKYDLLVQEQKELVDARDDAQGMAQKFKQRSDRISQSLRDGRVAHEEQIAAEKAKLSLLDQEKTELMRQIPKVEAALREEEAAASHLKQQTEVFAAVPEKRVVFTGETEKAAAAAAAAAAEQTFEMKSRIVYPMDGGTALVTFEEEVVAEKVLSMKQHRVDLGAECSIVVEARPVRLTLPDLVEIDSEVCPRRILISDLPAMDEVTLLNQLEIHFSKSRNGGGEVDDCEMLPDSGTVLVAFVQENVARGLTATEFHQVQLQGKQRRVRVTPFLNGTISNFRTKTSACPRTVLLAGIPSVMEQESLQDLLEIHFQKSSNGGGEIEAFLYNPLGGCTSAVFEDAPPTREEDEE